uniref:Photosystem I assembly protein Ycf4 n=1 Tax=Chroomonas mesostigmatica CCMP1168 TaxID=1195612 RepID=A0A248SPU9_9CRYP|nr:photosystem I assembly protein ycf4 [Chroomonas mesostigmatica CCMP1168]
MTKKDTNIRYDLILGSKRFSNYAWALLSLIGGLGFLLAGFSSYLGIELLPFADTNEIVFIPQGIVMTFYGTVGSLLSLFLVTTIIFNVGGGYNSYNLSTQEINIFRIGFPGLQGEILLTYMIRDIKSIKLTITEGLNPKREIYLLTKDKKQIPLTRVGEPLLLSQIEEEAVELADFLNVPLES